MKKSPQGLPQTVSGHQVISSSTTDSSVKDLDPDENVSSLKYDYDLFFIKTHA